MFDARCFNIPASEVVIALCGQEDATRNAIQMLGQTILIIMNCTKRILI